MARYSIYSILFVFFAIQCQAQSDKAKTVSTIRTEESLLPNTLQWHQNETPYYSEVITNASVETTYELEVLKEVKYTKTLPKVENIDAEYKVYIQKGIEAKLAKAYIEINALRRLPNGDIMLLIDYKLHKKYNSKLPPILPPVYAPHSVLSTGDFYKFSVSESGICKITYAFMQSLGMSVSGINTQHIRVYGNGGGNIPELNATARPDDLQENAIEVKDNNGNGIFDADDYLLFYAQGPTTIKWNSSTQTYSHTLHNYDTKSYYFLTVNTSGTGKRIATQSSLPSFTISTNTFDQYFYSETDLTNPAHGGRQFLGKSFRNVNPITASFNTPLMVGNIKIKATVAAVSTTSSTPISMNANGNTFNANVASVGISLYHNFYNLSTFNEIIPASSSVNIDLNATLSSNSDHNAWIDFITLNGKAQLQYSNGYLPFSVPSSIAAGAVMQYQITAPGSAIIWDITTPYNVSKMQTNYSGGIMTFNADISSEKKYAIMDGSQTLNPIAIGLVSNQDLHGIGQPDYVIVSHPNFINEAQQLADFYNNNTHLQTIVVSTSQVYNEFSSGADDLMAIRDFMRMLYDKAGSDTSLIPRYLLLFGDASYDHRNVSAIEDPSFPNTNFIPIYGSYNTNDINANYASDDLLACLDNNEGAEYSTNNIMDIGVGRFTCRNNTEAQVLVNKSIHYQSNEQCLGNWRNRISFLADDEEALQFMYLNDSLAKLITTNINLKNYNIKKVFLDAYPQVFASGGERYPEANKALMDLFYFGTLVMNYYGHGSELRLTHEAVFTKDDINSLRNYNNMPLVITGTCEYSRFDDPEVYAAGEQLYMNPNGGAIAMFGTVRLVYSQLNHDLVESFFKNLFPSNNYNPRLGDIFYKGKNGQTDNENKRKFALLGDPALQLAYPKYKVTTTSINNNAIFVGDTLSALEVVTIEGNVTDLSGTTLSGFNGNVYPTVFDKTIIRKTLQNDGLAAYNFPSQENAIFNGKATVNNGQFQFSFIVPKDIALQIDTGKISYYAENGIHDAAGYLSNIKVGGISSSIENDTKGPDIKLYLNDEKFAYGGLVNDKPLLMVKLYDEHGINTAGAGIGHDLKAILDAETNSPLVLNNYFETEANSYQKGTINYPMDKLKEGRHFLDFTAWDTYNNPTEARTEFVVAESANLALSHVLNYPNPFTTHTAFWFEHNYPQVPLKVDIYIRTVTGKVVKHLSQTVTTTGNRSDEITWDGLDEFGQKVGRGTYIYQLMVSPLLGGKTIKETNTLVILR